MAHILQDLSYKVCPTMSPTLCDLTEKRFQDSVVAKGFLCLNRDCYLGTVAMFCH